MDITDTDAHGLAGHDLRLLHDRCRGASEGAFRLVRASRPVTYAAWLTPKANADTIAVCCVSLRMPAGALVELRQWPWMIVPKHAIARGHQRLRDADFARVQSELSVVAVQALGKRGRIPFSGKKGNKGLRPLYRFTDELVQEWGRVQI